MKQEPHTIKVAIIGGAAIILAPIIAGIFGLFSNNTNGEKSINSSINAYDSSAVSIINNQNKINGNFVNGDKIIINEKGKKDSTNTKINAPKALIVTQNQTGDNTLNVTQVSDSYDTTSDGTYINEISFPSSGEFGLNILDKDIIQYSVGTYSMNALIPKDQNLTVEISGTKWGFPVFQSIPGWRYFDSKSNGDTVSRKFKTIKFGKVDLDFRLIGPGEVNIKVFENNAKTLSWSKTIIVADKISEN